MSEQQFSPVALRVALALAAVLVVAVVVVSTTLGSDDQDAADAPTTTSDQASGTEPAPRTGPLALVPVEAPDAGSAECATLVAALPEELPNGDNPLRRLEIAEPAPQAVAAWGGARGEPVVLRCGLARPAELTPTSALLAVNGVQWLNVEGEGASTRYLVDRPVYVALTVPNDSGTGPVQQISTTIADTLPAVPVRTTG